MKKTVIFVIVIFSITMAVFFVAQKQAIQEGFQENQRLKHTLEKLEQSISESEKALSQSQTVVEEKQDKINILQKQMDAFLRQKYEFEQEIDDLKAKIGELSQELTVTKNRKTTFNCKLLKVDEYRNTIALNYGSKQGAIKNDLLRAILQDRTIDLIITDVRPDFCIAVVQSTRKLPEKLVNDTYLSIYKTNE